MHIDLCIYTYAYRSAHVHMHIDLHTYINVPMRNHALYIYFAIFMFIKLLCRLHVYYTTLPSSRLLYYFAVFTFIKPLCHLHVYINASMHAYIQDQCIDSHTCRGHNVWAIRCHKLNKHVDKHPTVCLSGQSAQIY
jgi:hypothetical protein